VAAPSSTPGGGSPRQGWLDTHRIGARRRLHQRREPRRPLPRSSGEEAAGGASGRRLQRPPRLPRRRGWRERRPAAAPGEVGAWRHELPKTPSVELESSRKGAPRLEPRAAKLAEGSASIRAARCWYQRRRQGRPARVEAGWREAPSALERGPRVRAGRGPRWRCCRATSRTQKRWTSSPAARGRSSPSVFLSLCCISSRHDRPVFLM
jgi:hypothetical protein